MKKEAEISAKKYQDIDKQWSSILELNDPLDIYNEIELQKNERCTKLLAQKDVIIDELKNEIKNADEIFQHDQKQQSDEINLLIERIDNQVKNIFLEMTRLLSTIKVNNYILFSRLIQFPKHIVKS